MKNQDLGPGNISGQEQFLRKHSRVLLSFLALHALMVPLKPENIKSSMTAVPVYKNYRSSYQVLAKLHELLTCNTHLGSNLG